MITADAAMRPWFDGAPAAAFARYWPKILRNQFHDSLLTVAFVAGLGNALRSWATEEQRKIRESKLETAIARAGLAAVAARLRPDGVSDALREIGATIEHDPAQARELTVQLADTLREAFRRERPSELGA
jgi:LytS/YehU family sensor histidine kinase